MREMYAHELERGATNRELNKLLYDTAEKEGISLYDLCFHTVPKVEQAYPQIKFNREDYTQSFEINYTIKLEPVDFEFEKGPGYWKNKYYRLKEAMQKLIDSKTEELQND